MAYKYTGMMRHNLDMNQRLLHYFLRLAAALSLAPIYNCISVVHFQSVSSLPVISQDLRQHIVEPLQKGLGYRKISPTLCHCVPTSLVVTMIRKKKSRMTALRRITGRAALQLVRTVTRIQRTTGNAVYNDQRVSEIVASNHTISRVLLGGLLFFRSVTYWSD